jgi:hypothetical protein
MPETPPTEPPGDMVIPVLPENYAFVMNINRLIGAASYKFDRYHELRKATGDEIEFIKGVISKYAPAMLERLYNVLWEAPWPLPRGEFIHNLSEPNWRYYVISGLAGVSDLTDAFDLAPVELEVGFSAMYLNINQTSPGTAIHAGRFFHVLEHAHTDDSFFVDISCDEIETIRQIYEHLRKSDKRLTNVKRMARQLYHLKALPHYSPLRFLGYFAILESLLTHAPKPSDPYSSITRQVQKKLILLDHRSTHKIDYGPFGEAKPEKVWATMYGYRSLVAHGGEPDFSGELSLLKNEETALKLIKETAKSVIRQALSEPQLLLDLRDC